MDKFGGTLPVCCIDTKHFVMSKATTLSSIGNCFVFDSDSLSYSRFVFHAYATNDKENHKNNISDNYNEIVTKQYNGSCLCIVPLDP